MNAHKTIPKRQIRAFHDDKVVRVYQAYNVAIADAAIAQGFFVSPPFKMERMTWIKPSFLWMMYRAGWGQKDKDQARILAIDLHRHAFEQALGQGILSHPDLGMPANTYERMKCASPVRIQWDPERDLDLKSMPYRTIQIGLSGEAVKLYTRDWIVHISDVTDLAHRIKAHLVTDCRDKAHSLLPIETVYKPNVAVAGMGWPCSL